MSRDFLADGGEMGQLISLKNWDNHALGPVENWPQILKSTLSICLHSPTPMAVYWTSDLYLLYNDAASPLLGDKHPLALGKVASKVWSDVWDILGPNLNDVIKTGKGELYQNVLLPLHRRGFLEECYFDYTFTPIFEADKSFVGILNVADEVTPRILSDRRNQTLRKLSEKSITAETPQAACILAANSLSEAPYDVPYALIYLMSDDEKSMRLAASTALDDNAPIAFNRIDLTAPDKLLPYKKVLASKQQLIIRNVHKRYAVPGGAWDEMSKDAVILPIIWPKTNEIYGVIVAGVSPRLEYDKPYQVFYDNVAKQTATAIGVASDLERKLLLENREHDTQEQLQVALSGGLIGVWSLDLKKNIVTTDRNLADRFGIDRDDARIGLPLNVFTNSIHEDDREWVIKRIEQCVVSLSPFEAEYRTILRDGSLRWVLARGTLQTDKDGNAVRFPGVVVDITDRKEIEQELASQERMFKALFESSIIGVAVFSLNGAVHEANETFLAMFGYNKNDLKRGLDSRMITPPRSGTMIAKIFGALRTKGEVEPDEQNFQRKDGTLLPVMMGAVMIPGSADQCIAFMLDISDRKELIALNKAKDEFITIASHQLRTPATGVKQYIGMLLEGYTGTINKDQRIILETAYESNERQLAIVNDLLRVAQADANEITLNCEPTNLVSLIQDVINEQSGQFMASNQLITFTHARPDAEAYLDAFYMRMVFENIINNAHKYTPADKEIIVSLRKVRGKLVVSVKDQGVGIRKRDMPKLFKKFSRIENPLSEASGGTGLGLYWVHKIIDLHEGTIKVYSSYRKGTEFIITLPIGEAPQ